MTHTLKTAAMMMMAAGLSLAQPQYGQPANAGMREGAVCGQDNHGNPRTLGRVANRDMNGRTQYQWTCLSQAERSPRTNVARNVWGAFANYAAQPTPAQSAPPSQFEPQGPASPDFEQQYQQYQQYQQMMPPSAPQAYPAQTPPDYPNAAPMPLPAPKQGKAARAFRVLQQAGEQAGQIRQLYYNR